MLLFESKELYAGLHWPTTFWSLGAREMSADYTRTHARTA